MHFVSSMNKDENTIETSQEPLFPIDHSFFSNYFCNKERNLLQYFLYSYGDKTIILQNILQSKQFGIYLCIKLMLIIPNRSLLIQILFPFGLARIERFFYLYQNFFELG